MTPENASTDERASLYAALAFGGFTDADETERVAVWAAEHIKRLEAEVVRLQAENERLRTARANA